MPIRHEDRFGRFGRAQHAPGSASPEFIVQMPRDVQLFEL
jgi:hypothetical protein